MSVLSKIIRNRQMPVAGALEKVGLTRWEIANYKASLKTGVRLALDAGWRGDATNMDMSTQMQMAVDAAAAAGDALASCYAFVDPWLCNPRADGSPYTKNMFSLAPYALRLDQTTENLQPQRITASQRPVIDMSVSATQSSVFSGALPGALALTNECTIMLAVKPKTAMGANRTMFALRTGNAKDFLQLGITADGSTYYAVIRRLGGGTSWTLTEAAPVALANRKWGILEIAVDYLNDNATLLMDGVAIATVAGFSATPGALVNQVTMDMLYGGNGGTGRANCLFSTFAILPTIDAATRTAVRAAIRAANPQIGS
ncbi:hypothetical protein [Novosphingobium sp. RL4]|uniref:hypothetical protein n=1 Tax=Novosphingobium sp. RL4 TaxID=3109595 RepID=UPI002D77A527|nr:hypothetical protein [Novosphingobium sp. RL4]WRT94293.1 hypothetical protein U9J33_07285 [Novosphingobium sp. RL4]